MKWKPALNRNAKTSVCENYVSKAESSPWPATALTMRQRWSRRMLASRWGRAGCRDGKRRNHFGERRFAWDRESDSAQSRDDAKHPPESFLRFYLQRVGHSNRCGSTLSAFRLASQPNDRRGRNEPEFRLRDRKRAASASSISLAALP